MAKIMIFKRFERFWHWSQALLIFSLLLTGFEIHGSYQLFGFADATQLHTIAAFAMMVFIIGHVYMTTLGATLFSHIKPMVTGYDTVDEPSKKP